MTDKERMIEVIKQAFPPTDEAIADALIAAGFISLKTSSEWAREACDILRNIKDDEIKRICKERDDFARRGLPQAERHREGVCGEAARQRVFREDRFGMGRSGEIAGH